MISFPKDIRKTKQRLAVWEILASASRPISAGKIGQSLGQDEKLWKSTVYRSLDIFLKKGLVEKTVLSDGTMALYELRRQGHRHYALCTECHTLFPLSSCPLPDAESFTGPSFHVTGHKVEIYGICESCWKKMKQEEKEEISAAACCTPEKEEK